MELLYEHLEELVPILFDEALSSDYLKKFRLSTIDPLQNTCWFIDTAATHGETVNEATALRFGRAATYAYSNVRDENSQRLFNSSFFTTTHG